MDRGEFRYLAQILPGRNDTIIAWDNRFRVSRFDPEGKFVSSETYEPTSPEGLFNEGSTLLADGSLLQQLYRSVRPEALPQTMYRPQIRYGRWDPQTKQATLFGNTVYGGLRQHFFDIGGRRQPVVQPFTPHVQHAFGTDRVYVSDNEDFLIDVYAFDGRQVGQIRSTFHKPAPVTRAQLDEYHDRTVARLKESGREATVPDFESGWSLVEKPKTHPMFGEMLVDQEGLLWVQVNRFEDATGSQFIVLDRDGREVGQVRLPARFTPLYITRTHIVGRATDDLDVQYVRVYSLTRGSA